MDGLATIIDRTWKRIRNQGRNFYCLCIRKFECGINLKLTYQKFKEIFNQTNLANIDLQNSSKDDLLAIKQKILDLQKEKTQLLCQSIKFSTKIMTKILSSIERVTEVNKENEIHHLPDPVDLLTRIKLFLKITRLVVENANKEISESKGQQMQFFTMIKVLTEKIQSKLYSISNELIKSLMKNAKKRNSDEEENNTDTKRETAHCN